MQCTDYSLERISQDTAVLEKFLLHNAVVKTYPANSIILAPGDTVKYASYMLEGISVHTTISVDGQERILYRLGHGWFFSEAVLLYDGPIIVGRYAIAETPVKLFCINKESFFNNMNFPLFRNLLIDSLYGKFRMLQKEIESYTFESSKYRLLSLIDSYSDRSRVIENNWYAVNGLPTQNTLAAIMGVNRVTISRLITELKNDGCIRTVNKMMQINRILNMIPRK